MKRKLRVDFYKVSSPLAFEKALSQIMSMRDDDARNFMFSDGPVRLRVIKKVDGFVMGDMIRIRLGEPAFVAKLHGGADGLRPITMDEEEEGLGESNAFLYHVESEYLAYQRNRSGVSASRTAFYVEQKNSLSNAVEFAPVLSPVKINDLLGKGPPKRLTLRVAVGGIDTKSADNAAIGDVIEAAHELESRTVEVSFSMGRGAGDGMKKDKVVGYIKNVLRLRERGHDVQTLEVAAPDESGGKSEIFNFLDATLLAEFDIESSPLVEEFFRRRMACLREAWDANRNHLR